MYPMEVSYGVTSSKNIIPMFSKIPRHWLIRFVIGCGQFWLLPRTTEEKNDLDAQRNQVGGASESAASTKQQNPSSARDLGYGTPKRCAWLPFYSPAVAAMRLCFGVL